MATGFEGVAMCFLAFEDGPIVVVNDACCARGCQGQSKGRIRPQTLQARGSWAYESLTGGPSLALPRKWRVMSLMEVASGR